jgi:hypothetical protein
MYGYRIHTTDSICPREILGLVWRNNTKCCFVINKAPFSRFSSVELHTLENIPVFEIFTGKNSSKTSLISSNRFGTKVLLSLILANATSFPDLGIFRRASLAAAFDPASCKHVSERALGSRPTGCQPPRLREPEARPWSVRLRDEYPECHTQPSM